MKEKRFNLVNRLLHWSIALTILFLILTVLLRTGWMEKSHVGDIVSTSLQKDGITISKEAAVNIGRAVRKPMWNTHIIAGYVLIGLYVLRVIITAIQGVAYVSPFSPTANRKEKFRAWSYIIFYVLLGASLVTGFLVVNGPKEWKEPLEAVHVQSLYYVIAFIVIHIGGVLIADAKEEKGLISHMFTGKRDSTV